MSIVTGAAPRRAAQGIRLASALKFAEVGSVVIVCELKPEGVEQAVATVRARGAQALGFALNVTDRVAPDPMVAAVKEHFGSIDVLVNNAGITKDARLQEMTLEHSTGSSTSTCAASSMPRRRCCTPWSSRARA